MKKIQIKTTTGTVLFEYEKEDNTVLKTLLEAVKQGAYLQGAYLQGAYLQGAYLRGAYLRGADLQGADLQGAYLQGAYLQGADLQGAYLRGADLQGADLQGAYLQGAYLRGADLRGAYLQRADLRGAYLRGADLQGADLQGAYFNLLNILQLNIENISDELTLELMRWDSLYCGVKKMEDWAKNGGACPFSDDKKLRLFYFNEKKDLWKKGKPELNIVKLWEKIAKEMKIKLK